MSVESCLSWSEALTAGACETQLKHPPSVCENVAITKCSVRLKNATGTKATSTERGLGNTKELTGILI